MSTIARPRRIQALQPVSGEMELMLIAHIGERSFGLPVAAVERVIPMVAPTILPEAIPGVVGVINYQGTMLPVVDPRPRFSVVTPEFLSDQLLIVVRSPANG